MFGNHLIVEPGLDTVTTERYGNTRRQKTRIGFVLLSNSRNPAPSTRIAALNMFPFLREADFEPHIVFEPLTASETPNLTSLFPGLFDANLDIVVFQKVRGPSVENAVRELSNAGVKTVYSVCDFVDCGMVKATDMTIAVTDYLKSLHPEYLQPKIRVVHDGVENASARKTTWRPDRGSPHNPLRAVLVTAQHLDELPEIGSPPDWLQVNIVGRYRPTGLDRLRDIQWHLMAQDTMRERLRYLKFLADRRITCTPWHPVGVYEAMCEADIGIIPIQTAVAASAAENAFPSWKVRSENRLTMKMSVGLPVIATPIPSYEPVIEEEKTGFFARSRDDWLKFLEALRDPNLRYRMGTLAREFVLKRYSMEGQAHRLVEALSSLLTRSPII